MFVTSHFQVINNANMEVIVHEDLSFFFLISALLTVSSGESPRNGILGQRV